MKHWRIALGWSVVLIAGCVAPAQAPTTGPAGAKPSGSPSPTLTTAPSEAVAAMVPWSSATPPAPPATPPATLAPDAPICRANELAGGAGWGGATGSLLGGLLVWNASASPCRLDGVPSIAILDATGRALKVKEATAPGSPAGPIVLGPLQPAPVLNQEAPAGLASDTFQWFNWCAPAPVGPLRLAVTLPAGGVLTVPVKSNGSTGGPTSPRCDEAAAPSTMTVSAFEATPGPSPSEPPAVPAESLRLALEVPDEATTGTALKYVVALTNPTAGAISLTPCPAYRESLVTPSGQFSVDYLLDCTEAPSIGPGQTVRFAIELQVPRAQPPTDQAALIWELDPYYSEGFLARQPAQKVVVRIVTP
jgi:Protein of unknown function (DUF4232)